MSQEQAARLALVGGELCLDFANTVGNHNGTSPNEHLDDYTDLVIWSRHAGILSPATAQVLLREHKRHSTSAQQVFERAIALREALYRIFAAAAAQKTPKSDDIDLLNSTLSTALTHSRIIPRGDEFGWGWESGNALDQMLWPIARSAADLLTSDRLGRVHECEGNICGWLFVDTSKNHTRRWCSMGDCGNRAKVHRYYQRRRSGT